MPKTIVLFEIMEWDGGGGLNPTGLVTNDSELAGELVPKHGSVTKRTFTLIESKEDMTAARDQRKIIKTLARLSREERMSLGLPASTVLAISEIEKRKKELARLYQGG